MKRQHDTDMTEGSILRHLITFALPLLIGNLFQQFYTTVDSVVVGKFVSKQALAAVGTTGPIINVLIGIFVGLSAGAGVVISQHYGARDDHSVHEAVHTSMALTAVLGVIFTAVGVAMVPLMLRLMSTPEDVMADATAYLTIYFAGVFGLMIYNMGSGVLRAVGDSRRPLFFLILSALLNIVLDLFFVIALDMGVAGVAWATILSQFISAVLVLIVLTRTQGSYRLIFRDIRFNRELLAQIIRIGLPTAIQQAVTSFSNVFVQRYINFFNSDCMAGWSSYGKLDQFIMLPMSSVSIAATTFVGQNLGRGDVKRARRGTNTALILALGITALLTVPVLIFAPQLVMLFNTDEQVVYFGTLFLRLLSPFYVLCCFNQIYAGSLRGAGDARAPMVIMLCSFVLFRQIYLFIMSRLWNNVYTIALGYPAGWLVCSAASYLYYQFSHWEKRRIRLTEADPE